MGIVEQRFQWWFIISSLLHTGNNRWRGSVRCHPWKWSCNCNHNWWWCSTTYILQPHTVSHTDQLKWFTARQWVVIMACVATWCQMGTAGTDCAEKGCSSQAAAKATQQKLGRALSQARMHAEWYAWKVSAVHTNLYASSFSSSISHISCKSTKSMQMQFYSMQYNYLNPLNEWNTSQQWACSREKKNQVS